jgi:hypothetical protein
MAHYLCETSPNTESNKSSELPGLKKAGTVYFKKKRRKKAGTGFEGNGLPRSIPPKEKGTVDT